MAVASLVLGILSVLFCLVPGFGFALALVALIIAIVAMCQKKNKEQNKGIKIAGLVTAIIGFVIASIMTIITFGAVIIAMQASDEIINSAQSALLESDEAQLRAELVLEYSQIVRENLNGASIDKQEATTRYLNILKEEFEDLYEEGYTINVNDDLVPQVIKPNSEII